MQVLASQFHNAQVYNFSQGAQLGVVKQLFINQDSLKVELFEIRVNQKLVYLLPRDIKNYHNQRLIIDTEASLSEKTELVRYSELIKKPCLLLRYKVITQLKRRLGKCDNFSVDTLDFSVTKLYIKTNFLKNLLVQHLIVDKNDVIRVSGETIVVREALLNSFNRMKNVLPVQNT